MTRTIPVTEHFMNRFLERFPEYSMDDLLNIRRLVKHDRCMFTELNKKGLLQGVLKYKNKILKITYDPKRYTLISIWKEAMGRIKKEKR